MLRWGIVSFLVLGIVCIALLSSGSSMAQMAAAGRVGAAGVVKDEGNRVIEGARYTAAQPEDDVKQ